KHLLYEKRYTIEGARKHLEGKPRVAAKATKKATASTILASPMPKQQSSLFMTDEPASNVVGIVNSKMSVAVTQELREILKILGE
ncbi:MAG: hypothetical protein ABIQ44_14760, partial [Chloroflexia bacterium]